MPETIDLTNEEDVIDAEPLYSDSEDDTDLRRAIIMSLQSQQDIGTEKQSVKSSTGGQDDDDDSLRRATLLSVQHQAETTNTRSISMQPAAESQPIDKAAQTSSGLLGFDRKAMEAERLARLKRKREVEGQRSPPASKSSRVSPPPLRRQKLSPAPSSSSASAPRPPSTTSNVSNPFAFPKPQVLLTSHPSRHTSDGLSAISFRDILAPPTPNLTLKSALLSSFVADFDWVLPHFSTSSTKFIFILHAKNAQHRQLLQTDFAGVPNVRLVLPNLSGGGNMHSKLMLLFYNDMRSGEEICRVAIPSANLIAADWGASGVMENVVTVIDLPAKEQSQLQQENMADVRFERELKKQLRSMGVTDDVTKKLDMFDFGATKDIGFVQSMSGSHVLDGVSASSPVKQQHGPIGEFYKHETQKAPNGRSTSAVRNESQPKLNIDDTARTGLLSLSDTIASLGLSVSPGDTAYPLRLDFVTSSLGNLSTEFVTQLYQAACGQFNPGSSTIAKAKAAPRKEDDKLIGLIKRHLKIYFPSSDTVRDSKGGRNSAGTICFQKKWWESNELVRELLHDCVGVRGDGVLMHSKILYVRFNAPKAVKLDDNGETRFCAGWAYVGSGNLSESAWGRLVSDAKSKLPKMSCRNWESGVVIPVPLNDATRRRYLGNLRQQFDETTDGNLSLSSIACMPSLDRSSASKTQQRQKQRAPTPIEERAMQEEVENETLLSQMDVASISGIDRKELSRTSGVPARGNEDRFRTSMLGKSSLSEIFPSKVPLPMSPLAKRYLDSGKVPWFFMD